MKKKKDDDGGLRERERAKEKEACPGCFAANSRQTLAAGKRERERERETSSIYPEPEQQQTPSKRNDCKWEDDAKLSEIKRREKMIHPVFVYFY